MSTCSSPVSFDALVSYWSGDLDAEASDHLEAHVFGCAACTAMSERIAAITETLRGLDPPVISAARLAELRTAGKRIQDNFVSPGGRNRVVFAEEDVIIHHLGGLDLGDVDRVALVVRDDATNDVLTEYPAAPFDASTGEVLIACQRHFVVFPPNIAFELTTFSRGEAKNVSRYVVAHEWALT